MRLIDGDKLTEELKKLDWQDAYLPSFFKEFLLDEQPTAPAWISVKDRLPERHGLYIVMTDRARAIYSCLYMEDRGFVAEVHVQPGYGKLQMDTVTHWMEIPDGWDK